ncbi:MAG: hypothetical protein M3459_06960, partial [Actinomycetota bacterium]|nr:hypothetical protein [Actinomycetota bacterium]
RLERERDEAVAQRDAAVEELHAVRSRPIAGPRHASAAAKRELAGPVGTPAAELRVMRALTGVVLAILAALVLGAVL